MGLNLGDDGFLVYGVQRVSAGEVPVRDFQSYEPGRYYWCALWARMWGDGFLGVRRSIAVFQGIGLFFGLLVARRTLKSPWLLPLAGLVLWAWMFPRRKLFEPSLALMAVFAATCLLERPGLRRHLACGAFVGLAGFFGRNHALYAGLGMLCVVLYLGWKERETTSLALLYRRLGALFAGALLGATPLWLLMLFEPGFARAFLDSLLFFLERGSNLPKPYHWPWHTGRLTPEALAVSAAFLLPLVVYPLGWIVALKTAPERVRERSALLAAAFIGTFYAHHASVRSDASHLAESLPPALLGCMALPATLAFLRPRLGSVVTWGALLLVTGLAVFQVHPLLSLFRPGSNTPALVAYEHDGEELRIVPGFRGYLLNLEADVRRHVPEDAPLLVVPRFPGLYSLLGKSAPVWGLFLAWKEDEESQRAFLARLEERGVDHVFVIEMPIDNNPAYLFQNTHPIVWRYLQERFLPLPTRMEKNHILLRRVR